jgi:hypothetical protein
MTWFKKLFAQDYGDGSKGDDFLDVQDGSETNQNWINTTELSNGEGQGNVPDFGELNHPSTPDGQSATQNSDNTNQGRYERDTDDSARYTTMPFSEDGVDDNHNNNLTAGLISLYARQGEEADFFTSHVTGGPADSPQVLHDGHADEELQRDQEGIKSTTNNFDTSTKTDNSVFQDPGIVRKDNDDWDIAEVNKGRVAKLNSIWAEFNSKFDSADAPIISLNRQLLENECLSLKKKSEYSWGDDSNVQQIMDPDEVRNDAIKKGKDYGTGDKSSDDYQANAPLDDGTNPDAKNYSGIEPTASANDEHNCSSECFPSHYPETGVYNVPLAHLKAISDPQNPGHSLNNDLFKSMKNEGQKSPVQVGILRGFAHLEDGHHRLHEVNKMGWPSLQSEITYYDKKEASTMLDIIIRKADYGGVMPSVNPNSGRDDDEDEIRPYQGDGKQIDVMDTGKQEFNTTQNMDDKEFNDPSYYRQRRIKYDNTNRAGDDTKDYFNLSGSGQGGMGMESDGQNFSGVNNV